jgi:anti-sigma-K factor RskA
MNTKHENQVATPPDWMRWMDGEMRAAERAAFEKRLATDPALQAELESAQAFSAMLKKELPAEMPVPHPDFFNSQIQVRLAQIEAEERRPVAAPASPWLGWLRMPWLVGAAAAVVALLLVKNGLQSDSESNTLVMSTYAPNPKVMVSAFHSDAAEATVLMLDGLEELPADRKIVGWHLDSGLTDPATMTTAFSGPAGDVKVVVTRDAQNQPKLWVPRS